MRSRRNVLLLILGLIALVALTGAPAALAAGPYSMTISSAATSNMQCNAGNCYPLANGANLNVGDLESHMNAATLSKKLQAKLRSTHVKRVKVTITFTPTGGATRTISKTVSL
jgi:hypothetical protein